VRGRRLTARAMARPRNIVAICTSERLRFHLDLRAEM
jgi:hypothetical protein